MSKAGLWTGLLMLASVALAAPSPWLGPAPTGLAYPAGEDDRQYAILQFDLQQRAKFKAVAGETLRREALIWDGDRDPLDVILRRSGALLASFRRTAGTPEMAALAGELTKLEGEAARTAVENKTGRRALFNRACRLRRRIAFANPLLDFNSLLFIKRQRSCFNHMCDQYYGITQRPGGGVFELADPFGPNPRLRDVLENATVANGRLKGKRLEGGPRRNWNISFDFEGNLHGEPTQGGSFLSPELSFDGRTVAFAYVECEGDRLHDLHTDPTRGHWALGRCYHLFRVNLDGSGLTQLTDGSWNDFDPCFMPSGRVAFISERRGGYLRCGRVCPTFTVYDMAATGGDIRCLSFHETNEWGPSVTPEGLIAFTRWDYVDRHGRTAHHPWQMTPDGRDPRAIHGNFSKRPLRADMELDIRAIPGSHRYVATAAPHHGQAFGSLVTFDPRLHDDDAMGPVRRLTPDAGFPETQQGPEAYGTPWPLSEDFYLCAYDPVEVPALNPAGQMFPGDPEAGYPTAPIVRKYNPLGLYGLYLVDTYGNKELIYRDPGIGCISPIPVKARPAPPVIPEMSQRVAADQPAEATVGVVNVYESLKPWPKGTTIKALRVVQILPMSVPSGPGVHAHETGIRLRQGGDSVNLARAILGTVPVEEDGSAYFVAPARRELFFQALDGEGLAVTSMRSATQFQPGEQLNCQGCHEPRPNTPKPRSAPLAMRRPPSRIRPEADGTNPFSYPRLVQPVLDRHCVQCHARHPGKAPRLDGAIISFNNTKYYTSYVSLAPQYGFLDYGGSDFDQEKWYITTPGQFGARASRLYAKLNQGHHGLKLPAQDLHRLTLWLDACSLFYGVYEKEGGEAQLRGEIPRPTLE